MQNLAQTMKTSIFRPRKIGKCSKMNIENLRKGNSDHLLSVDGSFQLKFKVNMSKMVLKVRLFKKQKPEFAFNYFHLSICSRLSR